MKTQWTTAPGNNWLSARSSQDVVNDILTQASVLCEISDVQATALANHTTTIKVPTLYAFPMGVSRKQESPLI